MEGAHTLGATFLLSGDQSFLRGLEVSTGSRRDSGLVPTPPLDPGQHEQYFGLGGHATPGMGPRNLSFSSHVTQGNSGLLQQVCGDTCQLCQGVLLTFAPC